MAGHSLVAIIPGRVRAFINAVDVNVEGVAMVWQLRANSHKSLRNSTYEVLNDKETLMAFMLTAVLGDGYAYITDKPRIKLVIGTAKFRRWEPILNQLSNIGFKWSPQPGRDAVQITFTAGYAIDMAQAMINIAPPILRDILDVLSIEKWQRMKKIANMEVRFRLGESRVLVGGEPFTVAVSRGSVRLLRKVRDWAGVYRVLEVLRGGYGEDFVSQVKVHRSGGYIVIAIPARLIEGREDIRAQVISVLCRKYWRTSDDSRRMEVVRALSRFASLETISACLGNASQPH
ncbi:hypothetical protein [Vulcanisaeta sp. JCM 16161]|uniref:hypothetical protein n=1 Tax=Vulcanisaeta sp. JCM 16161 TaxID=1295372 RepID=UPI001FB20E13|nr:hypothetical protein [Vulcanisaeta sp. JCM 16161]